MNRSFKLSAATCAAALSAAFISTGTTAAAQTCGETYTVAPGDSLSKIAATVYGDASAFQIIYSANSGAIGPNPGNISVGLRLDIPCLGDTVASTAAPIQQEELGTERLPFPNQREIRFLTATGWAPYLNEDQAQGGMLNEVANVAMSNAPGGPDYKIDFVNDWGSHLTPLLSDHAYDLGLAWFEPNCEVIDRLGGDSQFRCNNYVWSDPMFEQIVGYYVPAGVTYSSYEEMLGKRICRPAGYATFMLEENNLMEPNISFTQPVDPAECARGLVDGTFDVFVIASDVADGVILAEGLTGQIDNLESLGQVLNLGAVISVNHPQRDEILEVFNAGLNDIKESGEWFEIVRRHLTEFRAMTQG